MTRNEYLEIRQSLDLQKKLRPLFSFFAVDALLMIGCALLVFGELEYLASPIVAIIMFRNFSLMHDASHNAICERNIGNSLVGFWCGCLSLLPFKAWKKSHMQHHIWSGNLHKDPVMALRLALPSTPLIVQKFLNFSWKIYFPMIAILQYCLFWKISLGYSLKSRSPLLFFETLGPLLLWVISLSLIPVNVVVNAILPGVLLYLIVVEIVNLPHHLQLPFLKAEEKLPAWEQHKTARSCLYPKWIGSFFTLNFNLHIEHHMFPDAPWYCLPKIHNRMRSQKRIEYRAEEFFDWTLLNRKQNIIQVISEVVEDVPKAS